MRTLVVPFHQTILVMPLLADSQPLFHECSSLHGQTGVGVGMRVDASASRSGGVACEVSSEVLFRSDGSASSMYDTVRQYSTVLHVNGTNFSI